MLVKNLIGTSNNTCKCGTWLKHWFNYSKQTTKYCTVKNCANTDLVGGHVAYLHGLDSNWYIAPICSSCNNSNQTLDLYDNLNLVPANVANTCG